MTSTKGNAGQYLKNKKEQEQGKTSKTDKPTVRDEEVEASEGMEEEEGSLLDVSDEELEPIDDGEGNIPQETNVKFNGEPNPRMNNSETDPDFRPEDKFMVDMTDSDGEEVTYADPTEVQGKASRMPVGTIDSNLPNTNTGVQLERNLGVDPADFGYAINFPPNVAREIKHTAEDLRVIQANSMNAHTIEAVIIPLPSDSSVERQQRVDEIQAQLPNILAGNKSSANYQAGQERAADARKAAKEAKAKRIG